jgi:hypothetical protein
VTRERHPYDDGYWARYDGKRRPKRAGEPRDGWDECDGELRMERWLEQHPGSDAFDYHDAVESTP